MTHQVHQFELSTNTESVVETPITGLYFLPYQAHPDQRGFYAELYRLPELNQQLTEPFQVKQQNLSFSHTKVIRGIHAENWQKLLTVLTGTVFCAFVDFRQDSSTFGQILTVTCGENGLRGSFYLPAGIGNSFCVLDGPANYLYAVDQLYAERDTTGDIAVNLFDPDLNIPWPIDQTEMILSDRDQAAISFATKFKDVL